MCINKSIDLIQNYKNAINTLQGIMYKDVFFNDIGIRILGIYYMDNGPLWSVNKHKHSFYEFHYVLRDSVFSNINDVEYNVQEGQYYILAPGTFHSHRQDGKTGHIGIALRWEFISNKIDSTEKYGSSLKQKLETNFYSNVKPIADNGDIINGLYNLFKLAYSNYFELSLQISFGQLVVNLAQFSGINNSQDNHITINYRFLENNIVNSSMKFIDENFDQEITVNDVANAVHLSYSHLAKLFRTYSTESVNSYICKVRLDKAKYLLKCTNEDISIIARKVGFNSENYFCNFIKKNIGMSASSYRSINSSLD